MPVYNANALPHPVLERIAYGAPAVPETWNGGRGQADDNFAHVAASLPVVVGAEADLATLSRPAAGVATALVLSELSLWIWLAGDADVDASELDFASRVRRVASSGGAWYNVLPPRRPDFVAATETAQANPGGVATLFPSPGLLAFSDGHTLLRVDVNASVTVGSGATAYLEILVDGSVEDVLEITASTPAVHFMSVLVLGAGSHTVNARLRSVGGTTSSVSDRRTLIVTPG